jgi:Rps23 Pro-64 3,4-dihydroxylase Tpa1-like proline 4-hydroxylase
MHQAAPHRDWPASPEFELNPKLDIAALRHRFATAGRLQICDFLTAESAAQLSDYLAQSERWRHIFNSAERIIELPSADWDSTAEAQRGAILQAIDQVAAFDFQYQYDTIRVPDRAEDRASSNSLLDRFAQFLSSGEVLERLMQITGSSDLVFADCQATRYRSGDFLTPHDDTMEGMNRRFAYVLSLTDGWLPRWGGLLHFVDSKGGVDETIAPRFNALSLFAIGQSHYVSQVASYAPVPRISVTGWLRTKVPR